MKKFTSKLIKIIVALFLLCACGAIVYGVLTGNNLLSSINGWWCLFIILFGFVGMIGGSGHGSRLGSFGLFLFGTLLFVKANAYNWLNGYYPTIAARFSSLSWWVIALFCAMLVAALSIFGSVFGLKKKRKIIIDTGCGEKSVEFGSEKQYDAVFTDVRKSYKGQTFTGAEINGIFSSADIDLSGAIIENDCMVEANAVFGNVVIYTDGTINIDVDSSQVFGSVKEINRAKIEGAPTVHVKANAVFGTVEIR